MNIISLKEPFCGENRLTSQLILQIFVIAAQGNKKSNFTLENNHLNYFNYINYRILWQ